VIALDPIGIVRSSLRERKNAPRNSRGAPEAILEIEEKFLAALEGVKPGAELIVVTWLHEAVRETLQVRPGRDPTRPLTGVFATRSPDRPNPIGLHAVTIESVAGGAIAVRNLEAVHGTPVLDIKPVLAHRLER